MSIKYSQFFLIFLCSWLQRCSWVMFTAIFPLECKKIINKYLDHKKNNRPMCTCTCTLYVTTVNIYMYRLGSIVIIVSYFSVLVSINHINRAYTHRYEPVVHTFGLKKASLHYLMIKFHLRRFFLYIHEVGFFQHRWCWSMNTMFNRLCTWWRPRGTSMCV